MSIIEKIEFFAEEIRGNSDPNIINNEEQIINSIQYIELIVKLEDEYDIEFPNDYLYFEGKLNTKKLAEAVEKLIALV